MNHCELGRWIGQSWNFFPSIIDVLENHHHPNRSVRDPQLVGIVAAADHFCEGHGVYPGTGEEAAEFAETNARLEDEFLAQCFPRLSAKERSDLVELLESEYLHLLPMLEFNSAAAQLPGEKKT